MMPWWIEGQFIGYMKLLPFDCIWSYFHLIVYLTIRVVFTSNFIIEWGKDPQFPVLVSILSWSEKNMLTISSLVSQTCQFMDGVEGNLNDTWKCLLGNSFSVCEQLMCIYWPYAYKFSSKRCVLCNPNLTKY